MVILWAVICNKDRVFKDASLPRPSKVFIIVEEEDLYVFEVDCLSYVPKMFVEVLYFLFVPKIFVEVLYFFFDLRKDNNSNNNVVVYLIIRVLI